MSSCRTSPVADPVLVIAGMERLSRSRSPPTIKIGDGLFAKKQAMSLLGPGGVGKSRLTTQFAISTCLGRSFLGLPVSCDGLKWLIIQAENSNRRLQADLNKHLTVFTSGDKARIKECLHFHTLEHERDDRLRLSDGKNAQAIARTISQYRPDVVVFDPLNAFGKGNLNTDDGMESTVAELTRICRIENPDTAIVIVHHTLTGKEGFKKAVGPDRGSYGRGSKALNSKMRGQINIAPGDPDDTRKIMIACGKNSNGMEFEPFGAILNIDTMLYDPDPTFSLALWKQLMCGAAEAKHRLTSADVAEFVRDLPLKKKALVQAIIEDTGCKKSTAYNAITLAETKTILMTETGEYRAVKVGV